MKERGIIMQAESVRAILEGRKVQTRRVMSIPPKPIEVVNEQTQKIEIYPGGLAIPTCPYGKPGDRLYVKECWAIGQRCKDGPDYWYKATEERCAPLWKSSMFMPRVAARILLEIVSVRVERVQDISEDDAKAEGVVIDPTDQRGKHNQYRWEFCKLWDSINGKKPGASMIENPWVWIIEFKRIEGHL